VARPSRNVMAGAPRVKRRATGSHFVGETHAQVTEITSFC
jgi:hypothetical protein